MVSNLYGLVDLNGGEPDGGGDDGAPEDPLHYVGAGDDVFEAVHGSLLEEADQVEDQEGQLALRGIGAVGLEN